LTIEFTRTQQRNNLYHIHKLLDLCVCITSTFRRYITIKPLTAEAVVSKSLYEYSKDTQY